MRSWGIWLLVLGIGAFVLPYAGLQFKILAIFGESLPLVAGGMAVIGAVMLALSMRATAAHDTAHDSAAHK
jgi:hypothetical protein